MDWVRACDVKPAKGAICMRSDESRVGFKRSGGVDRRRQVLLGSFLLGFAGLLLMSAVEKAASLPMPPPDLQNCHDPLLPDGASPVNCCPPYSETAIEFEFPIDLPMRIRPAAHTVDEEYMETYSRAVEKMKALPSDDPRSFTQQANVHCAYCNDAYYMGQLPADLKIHQCWYFLPWHRWYLYFHERILAKLIGNDTFALPFWNWDTAAGMTMPPMYFNSSLLSDALRNSDHLPPTLVDLNYQETETEQSNEELIAANYRLMYKQIVSLGKATSAFHGAPRRYVEDPGPLAFGTLESAPHNTVHSWTGSPEQQNGEDMGSFYSAARDPIFFAHHANVDRMWTIWKSLGRHDYNEQDFLESRFLFYDENARMVNVKVGDAFDPEKLRYAYEPVDIPWLNSRAVHRTTRYARLPGIGEFGSRPRELLGPINALVNRTADAKQRAQVKKGELEEVLVIEGIDYESDKALKFDVFVNLPESYPQTYIDSVPPEYAGTFVNLPHIHSHKHADGSRSTSSLVVSIGEVLEDLDAADDADIVVTLIPKGDTQLNPVNVSGIAIKYLNP